jgi:hypothetical protein
VVTGKTILLMSCSNARLLRRADARLFGHATAAAATALALAAGCGGGEGSGGAPGAPDSGAPQGAGVGAPAGDAGSSGGSGDGAAIAAGDGGGAFVHPGVLVNPGQLAFLETKSASAAPWNSALAATLGTKYASSTYAPQALANVECGSDSNPDIGCTAEMDDAIAAYTQALLWVLTGMSGYAQKAIAILDAWSETVMEHTDSNAPLQSAWAGSVFPRAAEILRWTNAGWAPGDVARFETMLRNVYLPEVIGGAPKENGNWELSMIEATMGIAVFLDDHATFDKAVTMWRARVPAYVYMQTDGPTPAAPPGGAYAGASQIKSFWYGPKSFPDGLCQETCRDLGHVQYGLGAMIHAAETARIQGVDLYSEQATRIEAALELHAGYLNAGASAASPCAAALVAVKPDPTWEVGYNEYANRAGASLPNTEQLINAIRPTGTDHHLDWESLTHAEVGDAGL